MQHHPVEGRRRQLPREEINTTPKKEPNAALPKREEGGKQQNPKGGGKPPLPFDFTWLYFNFISFDLMQNELHCLI